MKKETNDKQQACDPCEKQFERKVHHVVHEVEGYTDKEHRRKEQEVEDSFGTVPASSKK